MVGKGNGSAVHLGSLARCWADESFLRERRNRVMLR